MTQPLIQDNRATTLANYLATTPGPVSVTFFGTTSSTDQTELFIEDVANYRINVPEDSHGLIEAVCLGYNTTDDANVTATRTQARYSNNSGTTAVTQNTDVTNVYDDSICQITADDTNDAIAVNVTAADADTYRWVIHVTIYSQPFDSQGDNERVYTGVLAG